MNGKSAFRATIKSKGRFFIINTGWYDFCKT